MIQAGDTSRPEQIMPMMANEAGVASTDPPDENPATKGRRRSLPKPMYVDTTLCPCKPPPFPSHMLMIQSCVGRIASQVVITL